MSSKCGPREEGELDVNIVEEEDNEETEVTLGTHLSTSEGLTAELTDGLRFMIPTILGLEPTKITLQGSKIQRLNH